MGTPGLPPATPVGEVRRLPWEERDRLGIVEGLVQTVRLVATDPNDAFSRLRPDSDLTSPILFGILLSWLAIFLSQLWQLVFGNPLRTFFSAIQGFEGAFDVGIGGALGVIVLWPILAIVGLFLGAAVLHLCLMLVGATEQSPSGFEGTLKVVSYSQIAGLATVVPFIGGMVVAIWLFILEVIGFAAVHRTSQGKALAGVLIPVVLCCLCGTMVAVFFGAIIAAAIAGAFHGP